VLDHILTAAPDSPGALHLLGIVAFRGAVSREAMELIERAIALLPGIALFYRNLCEIYRKLSRYDDALIAGRRAVELAPTDPHALQNLSVLYYHRLELGASIVCAEQALVLDREMAGAHFGIAEASLLRGDFARGWEEYQWRFRLGSGPTLMPPTDRPRWDGKPLRRGKTLLLIADQGYGDVIQFRATSAGQQSAVPTSPSPAAVKRKRLSPSGRGRPDLRSLGRQADLLPSVRCPGCRGSPAPGWKRSRPRSPTCTPILTECRLDRTSLGAGAEGLPPDWDCLGGAPDPQQRRQPLW
jgi:hypothetical protein